MPTLTVDANIKDLCGKLAKNSAIDPALYEKYHIKRGLRNSDGTGVKAGITNICNVHGYLLNEGELEPIPGQSLNGSTTLSPKTAIFRVISLKI